MNHDIILPWVGVAIFRSLAYSCLLLWWYFSCQIHRYCNQKGISLVSTELGKKSDEETLVWAKSGFKSNQELLDFPTKLGKWQGHDVSQRKMTELRERLDANVFLMRTYYREGFSTPVFFLIIQAKESSAFHRPPVCYRGQGYLVEEAKDEVRVKPDQMETDGTSDAYVGGVVPMKKLWLSKRENNEVTEHG